MKILLIIIAFFVYATLNLTGIVGADKDLINSLPDPDRNYYDEKGNEYNYKGQQVKPAKIEVPKGFTGK